MTIEVVHAFSIASAVASVACFVVGISCIRIMQIWSRRMAMTMFVIAIALSWVAYMPSLAFIVSVAMASTVNVLNRWYWRGGRERHGLRRLGIDPDRKIV